MFFHLKLNKYIIMHPRNFGAELHHQLRYKLKAEVEGTCSGRYGFIVMVTDIRRMSSGVVLPSTAHAKFFVEYSCIAFRPFKGEVLDAIVSQVTALGVFAAAGPLPLFVSEHLFPEDFRFSAASGEPAFESLDGHLRIERGSEVRLKVVGTRADATEIFCIATLNENYLGVIGEAANEMV